MGDVENTYSGKLNSLNNINCDISFHNIDIKSNLNLLSNHENVSSNKIIIFYRSGGFQDLKEAYKNQSSNHSFYILDRTHLKNIYK